MGSRWLTGSHWLTGSRWRSAATLVALQLTFAPAAKGAASAEERAVAADLFRQATEARESGEWQRCERQLERAIDIVETPGLRFHLAYCKEQQQRWVEALVDYRRAGELIANGEAASDVSELLPDAIRRLEVRLPRLELSLDPVPEGTELYLDGQRRSTQLLGHAIPLDPGTRRVEVIADGYEVFAHQVTLLPSEHQTLEVVLVPKETDTLAAAPMAGSPRETSDAREPTSSALSTKTYVMLAEAVVGAVGFGVGVAFSIRADDLEQSRATLADELGAATACGDSPVPRCERLSSLVDDVEEAQTIATAGYVTGAVGAAALVATWLLWPENEAVAVTISPSQQGLLTTMQVTF